MLTIVNIDKLKGDKFLTSQILRVAGEKWQLSEIQTSRDVYQFVYRCIELNPTTIGTKVLGREAIIDLCREQTMIDLGLGVNVYELKCLTNGKSRLVGIDELRAPGRLISPMLRVIEGC
jgi:hypothetical protein